mmetsp:Transcript_1203/g.2774  ORF Transcript_1203/g.2774 Transcript_1203/m.2774 type:complete len:221 (+) Transcript_1203:30-692(+)
MPCSSARVTMWILGTIVHTSRCTEQFGAQVDVEAALPEQGLSCHARDGYDLSGDAAYVWGLNFHVTSTAACCRACAAHARVCSQAGSRGATFWTAPQARCSGRRNACNAWVFCAGTPSTSGAEQRCFSYDVHNHTRGECWLKHEPNPANPIAAGPILPLAMRTAPRKKQPWAVARRIWPWPVPQNISWQSGILAPRAAQVWSTTRQPGWYERFCRRHGPC